VGWSGVADVDGGQRLGAVASRSGAFGFSPVAWRSRFGLGARPTAGAGHGVEESSWVGCGRGGAGRGMEESGCQRRRAGTDDGGRVEHRRRRQI
jgi:hypothetical protein